jgi:hypothetical protein
LVWPVLEGSFLLFIGFLKTMRMLLSITRVKN